MDRIMYLIDKSDFTFLLFGNGSGIFGGKILTGHWTN